MNLEQLEIKHTNRLSKVEEAKRKDRIERVKSVKKLSGDDILLQVIDKEKTYNNQIAKANDSKSDLSKTISNLTDFNTDLHNSINELQDTYKLLDYADNKFRENTDTLTRLKNNHVEQVNEEKENTVFELTKVENKSNTTKENAKKKISEKEDELNEKFEEYKYTIDLKQTDIKKQMKNKFELETTEFENATYDYNRRLNFFNSNKENDREYKDGLIYIDKYDEKVKVELEKGISSTLKKYKSNYDKTKLEMVNKFNNGKKEFEVKINIAKNKQSNLNKEIVEAKEELDKAIANLNELTNNLTK